MITRELLEHYLRATGWTPNDRGNWKKRGRGTIPAFSDPPTNIDVVGISIEFGRSAHEICYRLGLCAAAEYSIQRAYTLYDPVGGPARALYATAEELLRLAGVDPARWEEARR